MKKLMFISLLVIPFCKAADDDGSWNRAMQRLSDVAKQGWYIDLVGKEITALPENLSLSPNVRELNLRANLIQALPENFNLPNLKLLDLRENQLDYVDPKIIQQLPNLEVLNLDGNPLIENFNDTEADARASMLIYLIENKLIEVPK